MAVYDDQKPVIGRDDTLKDEPLVTDRSKNSDDIKILGQAESGDVTSSKTSKSTSAEQAALDKTTQSESSSSDSPWETKTAPPKKVRFSMPQRRVLIGGGVAGGIVGVTFAISTFLSGPLQFIHFAQLLTQFHFNDSQSFSDNRAGKLIRWARTTTTPEDRNLGRAGTKLAQHYDVKLKGSGIEFKYNSSGRLSTISVDPTSESGKKLLTGIEEEQGVGLPKDADGKVRLVLAEESGQVVSASTRRKLIKNSVAALELNGVSSSLSSRMLKARAGVDFHPLKNVSRSVDEKLRLKFDEYVKKVQEERNKRITQGEQDTKISGTAKDTEGDKANPKANTDTEASANEANAIANGAQEPDIPLETKASSLKAGFKTGVGAAGVIAIICSVKQIGDSVGDLQESNVVQPLIRTGMDIITIGSQVQSGQDVNLDELGALSQNFYNEKDKTSWSSARSIQAELGHENTGPDIPSTAKPGKDKPAFFKGIDSLVGSIPGFSTACDAVSTTVGSFALDAAGWISAGLGPVGIVTTIVTDQVKNAVVANYIDDLVRYLAGDMVNVAGAAGAELGNYANYGAFLASNNTMRGMGGRALTTQEVSMLRVDRQERIKEDMKNKPLYARLFNPYEPNSLVAKTFLENPNLKSTQSTFATLIKSPINSFSEIGKTFSSLIPGASAESVPYDYGVDTFGFSVDEINNSALDDPYENAKQVEPKLEELNSKYGEKCFGTTIDPSTGAIKYSTDVKYIDIEANQATCGNQNKDSDYLRYRMYLADTITMASVSCFESIDEGACQEIGLANSPSSTPSTPNTVSSTPSTGGGVGQDTSAQSCSVGKDAGIGVTPDPNIKIRLCNVGGVVVNVTIEKNVKAAIDGAKSAGISLSGGGYRSNAEQVILRKKHCPDPINSKASDCTPPTAKAGTSLHEWGLAVDFDEGGGTLLRKGSSGFNWMSNNKSVHNLINLPSEPWHWSLTGN